MLLMVFEDTSYAGVVSFEWQGNISRTEGIVTLNLSDLNTRYLTTRSCHIVNSR